MTQLPNIRIENVSVKFRENQVLTGFAATFSSGQVVRITGKNGSGKTTLLRVISGLLVDHTGTVAVHSRTLRPGDRLPLVSSPPRLFPYLTVSEHLAMARKISEDSGREAPAVDIAGLGLGQVEDSLAEELSLGQRQRLSLGNLLSTGCDVWLMDEPFNGLDDEGVGLLRGHIGRHAESGGIVLVATHDASHVAGLATHTVELTRQRATAT